MTTELPRLLLALLCIISSLLIVETWVLGLNSGEAQFNGLIEQITKRLEPTETEGASK